MPQLRPPGPRIDDGVDKRAAIKFLRLLDAKATAFTFQTFKEKGDASPQTIPSVIHSNSFEQVRREHAFGAGVYVCVNDTDGSGRKAENIVRIRAVFQEDDGGFDGVFPLEPSMVVETSPGHFHRYWLVSDEWPADEQGGADFAAVMERMCETYGCDKNAKDISRSPRSRLSTSQR